MSHPTPDHPWLLSDLVDEVPGLRSVVLLSVDGLPMSWHGISTDDAARLAAMASAMSSLASNFGAFFCQASGSGVKQVAVEWEHDVLLVAAAGTGSVLAALAGQQADLGTLSYEMAQLCCQVSNHFDTAARTPSAPSTEP